MSSLYNLTGDYLQVLDMLQDDEVDEQTIIDTLESIGGEIEDKADNYARLISSVTGDVDAIDKEIGRLTARKKSLENRVSSLKRVLEMSMRATNKLKFKTPYYSFNIAKNGGKRKLTISKDVAELPVEFQIQQPPKADTEAIREYLKANNMEECDFCYLEEQGESLRIK